MSTYKPLTLTLSLFPLLSAAPGCFGETDPDPDEPPAQPDGGSSTPDDPDPPEPDAPDAAPLGFVLSGDVTGAEIPADAEVIVAWPVWDSQNDHATKWGDGTSSGSHFTLAISEETPPSFALNDFGAGRRLGIGFLVLVPTGTALPDGVIDPDNFPALGIARTPIIWREGTMWGDMDWVNAFEEATYQCGRCVPAGEEETFDTFEPVDCAEVEIATPADNIDCNFT